MAKKASTTRLGRRKQPEFIHKGPLFPPAYRRLQLKKGESFKYNKKVIKLSPKAEECAVMYAKYLMRKNKVGRKLQPTFDRNFLSDWRQVMTHSERRKVKNMNLCDFSGLVRHLEKRAKKRLTRAQTEMIRKDKTAYAQVLVNGKSEKVKNPTVEPPGIFSGRGNNPHLGRIKRRIEPEDVTINATKVPKPPPGTKWKEVVFIPGATWTARYTDTITGGLKYILLHESSHIKNLSDEDKFNKAVELGRRITSIRNKIQKDLKSKDRKVRQLATAAFFIDNFALRVGHEKGEGETDTVGCCNLRREHVQLKSGGQKAVVLKFVGKDSVPFTKEFSVGQTVFNNVNEFWRSGSRKGQGKIRKAKMKKTKKMPLFDEINASKLNAYLDDMMEGLTAKAFRTYKATEVFRKSLNKYSDLLKLKKITPGVSETDAIAKKLVALDKANIDVAVQMNHKNMANKRARRNKYLKHLQKIDLLENELRDLKKELKKTEVSRREAKAQKVIKIATKLEVLKLQSPIRKELVEWSLTTSKGNYIDPRVTLKWCNKFNVPITKVYTQTQRSKFKWAIE